MTTFFAELRQQPAVLAGLARQYEGTLAPTLARAGKLAVSLPGPVVLSGMGSSNWAAEYTALLLAQNGRTGLVWEAGELLHYGEVPEQSLLVLISQSGESAETVALARKYAGRRHIVAVTNETGSALAGCADLILPLLAGAEEGTTNKTFVASLAALAYLALTIAGADTKGYGKGLRRAAAIMAEEDARWAGEAPAWYGHLSACAAWSLVARGYCVAAVRQGSLIAKEMAGLPVEGYAGGTFRHGPLELADPRHGVAVLAPAGDTRELGLGIAREAAALGSPTLLLTDAPEESAGNLLAVPMPSIGEEFSPFLYIVPLEYLAAEAARARGHEPGVMRRARKVTRTE